MKNIFLAAILLTSTSVFATSVTKTKAKPVLFTTNQTTETYVSNSSHGELTGYLGFVSGAANIGATYAQMEGSTGFGGYFGFQTEKESASVNQMITLGGLFKINILDTSHAVFYAAPGFGVSMVKVSTLNSMTLAYSKSDKTVFGPSLKLGAQYKISSTMSAGVEHMIATNYFEEAATANYPVTTLAMTFIF